MDCVRRIGNDTIDPYPLMPKTTEKILIVRKDIFEELQVQYKAFLKGLRGHPVKRSPLRKATRERILKPKAAISEKKHFRAYEPSNAIGVNECDYRRWCRVTEWFYQFSQQAINFEKNYVNQIKVDT